MAAQHSKRAGSLFGDNIVLRALSHETITKPRRPGRSRLAIILHANNHNIIIVSASCIFVTRLKT